MIARLILRIRAAYALLQMQHSAQLLALREADLDEAQRQYETHVYRLRAIRRKLAMIESPDVILRQALQREECQ